MYRPAWWIFSASEIPSQRDHFSESRSSVNILKLTRFDWVRTKRTDTIASVNRAAATIPCTTLSIEDPHLKLSIVLICGISALEGFHMKDDIIVFGGFELSIAERLLKRSGSPVKLSGRAFDILVALVEHAGEIVDKKDLMALVWPDVTVDENSLRFHVAALRKALGDREDGARYVTTLPGRGYCFVSPISRSLQPSPETGLELAQLDMLPARQTRSIGRADDIQRLSEQTQLERFETSAGSGRIREDKTGAVPLAHMLAAQFQGAVYVFDLGTLKDAQLVSSMVASALSEVMRIRRRISVTSSVASRQTLSSRPGCRRRLRPSR
jgi:DNA-binding winged helix-turn-helix (wHTH) protein